MGRLIKFFFENGSLGVRLENPFLGKNCYVGSYGSPITYDEGLD